MTPKNKAEEIYTKYRKILEALKPRVWKIKKASKDCSMLLINDLIEQAEFTLPEDDAFGSLYWEDVKKALKKI